MVLAWAIVALVVLIAVIAFLNRRPSGSGLPSAHPPSSNADEFTDISGPADIHFAPPTGSRSDSHGSIDHATGAFTHHDAGGHG